MATSAVPVSWHQGSGHTWRDRPAIDRGDGVWLCGDYVAAPGLLAEVSWSSGVTAGRAAARSITLVRGRGL